MTETETTPTRQVALTVKLAVIGGANMLSMFALYWLVFTKIGAGWQSDAFFAALVVPQLVLSITQTSLRYVLIPILSVTAPEQRGRSAWGFLQWALALFASLAVLLFFTSPAWIGWLVPGFSDRARELTLSVLHVQLFAMVFTATAAVLAAAYHANGRFVVVEVSEAIAGLAALGLFVWLLPSHGVHAAAWALVLRVGMHSLVLLPGLGPYHFPRRADEATRVAWVRALPLLAGSAYSKLDIVVDRVLASLAGPGVLSLLNLAQQLYGAGNILIDKAFTAPVVPELSRLADASDWAAYRRRFRKRLVLNGAVATVAVVGVFVIGQPLLEAIFAHGVFSRGSVGQLWTILLALFGLLVFGAMGQVAAVSFYALGDTKTPTFIGALGFTVGIGFKIVGFLRGGVVGLALATSAYYLLVLVVLQVVSNRRIRRAVAASAGGDDESMSPGSSPPGGAR